MSLRAATYGQMSRADGVLIWITGFGGKTGRMNQGIDMQPTHKLSDQGGFTLVELAISITVIGILVAGVLKGVELIDNSRVTTMVKQLSDYNTATSSFVSLYNALPGDIANPSHHIPNCNEMPCSISGNENGVINNANCGSNFTNPGCFEASNFFMHLRSAGLLRVKFRVSGSFHSGGTSLTHYVPVEFPYKSINLITVGHTSLNDPYWIGPTMATQMRNFPRQGHYYMVHRLPVKVAEKIDFKIDDGKPYSGEVRIEDVTNGGELNTVTRYRDTANYSNEYSVNFFPMASF